MNKELTQKEKVLNYIKKIGYITSMQCFKDLDITDLQSNIRDLKNLGYDIKSKYVTNKKSKKTYKVYALKDIAIKRYEERFGC